MKKNILNEVKFVGYALIVISPVLTFAQANLGYLKTLFDDILTITDTIRMIMIAVALIYFFWGMTVFIYNAGDSKAREEGKQRMLWSIIAMFVIISIFGIIDWIGTLSGIPSGCPRGGNYPFCY